MKPQLNNKQIKQLKTIGHHISPVVQVGKNGLSESQYDAIKQALVDHELIKVRLGKSAPYELEEMIEMIVENTSAVKVQSIGKIALIYAPHPEEPTIELV